MSQWPNANEFTSLYKYSDSQQCGINSAHLTINIQNKEYKNSYDAKKNSN